LSLHHVPAEESGLNNIPLISDDGFVCASFVLHKTGLTPIGTPSYQQWLECGEFIKKAAIAVHFWIGDWLNYGEQRWGNMYAQAIEQTGFDYKTLRTDKWVAGKVQLSRRRDNLSFAHHTEVAFLEPGDQEYLLGQAEKESIPAKAFRRMVRQYKERRLGSPDLPAGKYNILYIDPPWDINPSVLEKWRGLLKERYPTMTLDALKALQIQDLAFDDCVCFLWATLTMIPQALELLEHWGFAYHILLTWDKGNGWCANGFHRRSEVVLVGYKGILSNVIKQEGDYIPTVFYENHTTHSTKPQIMYRLIEQSTEGKRIELFARQRRAGWDVWGNEV
jgi:N6-adenosine-specific RNA methylase IME4